MHALGAEVIIVDYRQPEALRGAVAGADVAVHLAGALLPRRGETLLQANVETTQALVEAAISAGVKTFVYLSFPGADPASRSIPAFERHGRGHHAAGRLCRCYLPGANDPRTG